MSSTDPTGDRYCVHGIDMALCAVCSPPYQHARTSWYHPSVAGHCGKCGAPYTMDMLAGIGPPKFIPSCQCWNVSREVVSPKYCKACGAAAGEDCKTASTLEVPQDCINLAASSGPTGDKS